jgi:NAD-dependent SIR2 family protein deacetylase
MTQRGSRLGAFRTNKMAPQTIRQRHATGPQHNGRVFFNFPSKFLRLNLRQSALPAHDPRRVQDRPETWHRHLAGDVNKKPMQTYFDTDRKDKVVAQWKPRGRLSLHQIHGKTETFVCYRCGYPVKSRLVAVKDDNWDFRMCYRCYCSSVRDGLEDQT